MTDLYGLDQIQSSDRWLVGDKAFYLSTLRRHGYPVIPGYVISARVFRDFLESINWLEPLFADLPNSSLYLDINNPKQLQGIAQQIRQTITGAPLTQISSLALASALDCLKSPAVILRPSINIGATVDPTLTARTTGLLESQICRARPESVLIHLKRVWAELFRARSLFYWQRSRIQVQQINLAVLIQPLYAASAAGKVEMGEVETTIQSVDGLGMALVRGEVIPDRYQISSVDGSIQSQKLGHKTQIYRVAAPSSTSPLSATGDCLQLESVSEPSQSYTLTQEQLATLIRLAQEISPQLGASLLMEWLVCPTADSSEAQVWITQANPWRPIKPDSPLQATQSSNASLPEFAHDAADLFVEGIAASPGQVMAPAVVIPNPNQAPTQLPPGRIIVASTLSPDWLPYLQTAVGIISEQGGLTSHGAILARELGIPAIVNAAEATRLIQLGELILLDGDRGAVHRTPPEWKKTHASRKKPHIGRQTLKKGAAPPIGLDKSTAPPIATQLMVSLSQTSTLEAIKHLPVDGVGLLRSELMLIQGLERMHPKQWLDTGKQSELLNNITHQICQFAQAFAPRPVRYRSLDLRSHEFLSWEGSPPIEQNPMLGVRGALSYQLDPRMFDLELEALKQVQQLGYSNIQLILPFVRTVEEFTFCRQRVKAAGLFEAPHFQLWMMAEVPSVLFLLPAYIRAGVQGVAIGTNDLTQLLLGIDRDQAILSKGFSQPHPVVMEAIAQIIQMARQAGVPTSICGEAPARHPEMIASLVNWGVTSISVPPDALEQTYGAIAKAEKQLNSALPQSSNVS
ncbi:MAG: PEP/pyruvate-binding domain-containing protein [Leptolyngbyaceae cyanobacterium MO_188.B28]|nr:PEP/pyruvate-binding domain-containing protein [Leptolyngbyaceae cyanobacterium MO_188.B28]